jgi:hypothetical protein
LVGEEDFASRLDDKPEEFVAAVRGEEVPIVEWFEETQSMEAQDSRTSWLERRILPAGWRTKFFAKL